MQRVTLVRYTTKPGRTAENETLARAVFGELRSTSPDAIAYALLRDGNDFIHVFLNLQADAAAAVTELPAFKTFLKDSDERYQVAPQVTRLAAQLVECYGFGTGRKAG